MVGRGINRSVAQPWQVIGSTISLAPACIRAFALTRPGIKAARLPKCTLHEY